MEQKKHNPNDPGTWQTGRTEPPKRHSALISILLVLVILLSGISTALSILNFKLYKELTRPEATPSVAFSRGEDIPTAAYHEEDMVIPQLGIQGVVIPEVYQRYYKLPDGFYISRVEPGSQASAQGIVTGDIITQVNGISITENTAMSDVLEDGKDGQELLLSIYRSGNTFTAFLVWEEAAR